MRARFAVALALALLLSSCADDGVFSTLPTGAPPTSAGTGASTTEGSVAPSTTGSPETTTTTAAIVEWSWSRIAPEEGGVFGGPDDQILGGVAVGGPGLVAVGSDFTGGDFDAAVWTSPDGLAWTRVPHDETVFGGLEYQRMWGVAVGGPGLVAVGFDSSGGDRDAAVWASPDGITWSRLPHDEAVFGGPEDQSMNGVVARGSRLVAFGTDASGGDFDVAVWTSPDGLAWSRVPHDEAVFGGADDQMVEAMLAGSPGVLAVGLDFADGDGDAAVWASNDGLAWSRLPHDEAVFGGPESQWMTGVAVTPSGLVGVGFDSAPGDDDAAVWTSRDALSWSRLPLGHPSLSGPGDQGMAVVAAVGGGLVAVGYDYSEGDADVAVWTSSDGVTWARTPHDETTFGGLGDQRVLSLVVGGPGLVAVGLNDTGADRDGALWVAVPSG